MTTTEFKAGGKALTVEEDERGDIIIGGYAAVWGGEDRESEAFASGAFDRGVKAFLGAQSTLLFHHQKDAILGRVLELEPDDYGLRFKARIDGAVANDPKLGTIYRQIQRGTINGVSVGGYFKRDRSGGKSKIVAVDLSEISLTAQPVDVRPRFSVLEQKALRDPDSLAGQLVVLGRQVEYLGVALGSFLRIAAATRR